jgi:signal transduction histidine kinase/CheY-like chemotaxis protein
MLSALKHSIRHKLMLVVMATTFAALLITAIGLVYYDLRTYQQAWVDDLVTQADILGLASAPALAFHDPKAATQNLELLKVRPKILAAAIYSADGRLFASYEREGTASHSIPGAPGQHGHRVEGNHLVLFRSIADADEVLGTVYLKAHYEMFDRFINYMMIVGGVMIVSLLIAILMSYWLQAAVTKPILQVSEVAHQVTAKRDFSLRVEKTTEDELGYLVDTFNDMLTEVGQRTQALEKTNQSLEKEMAIRHEAEMALLAADQRKDEFLATLAHELRNPLAPFRNALEILRIQGDDPRSSRMARDIMERQLRQLVRLVDDLLDVSRITTGKLRLKKETTELRSIVQSALDTTSSFIESRKLDLDVTLPEGPVHLHADATRLAQVLVNLLHNAAKFTEAGGRISLNAECREDRLTIYVSDTGIGIAPEMLPVIFDMFAQIDRSLERPHAGLGVGLSLARRLVELHGGTLTARSAGLGQGSQFIVDLPVVPSPGWIEPAVPAAATGDAFEKRRILLADDNEDFIRTFATILRSMGHEVHLAHDGQEALREAERFRPEVAFLDIGLPKLNGYDLARGVRSLPACRDTLLVAVTGWGQENDRKLAVEAGFDHHLTKPIEPQQVLPLLSLAPRTGAGPNGNGPPSFPGGEDHV